METFYILLVIQFFVWGGVFFLLVILELFLESDCLTFWKHFNP